MLRLALKRAREAESNDDGVIHKKLLTQRTSLLSSDIDSSPDEDEDSGKPVCGTIAENSVLGQHVQSEDEEEKMLEKAILGGEDDVIRALDETEVETHKEVSENAEIKKEIKDDTTLEDQSEEGGLKPAWVDEDDESEMFEPRVTLSHNVEKKPKKKSEFRKHEFKKLVGAPKWAQIENKPDTQDDDIESILQRAGDWIDKSQSLSSIRIDVKKCTMLNSEDKVTGYITGTEFHRHSQVALVAAKNGKITLFQVDGRNNPKIQSVLFQRFLINTAHFSIDGREIIASSKLYSYFYSYDMMAGKLIQIPEDRSLGGDKFKNFELSPDGKFIVMHGRFGKMHLMMAKSKEHVATLKMNGDVRAITFDPSGSTMYSHGENGQVYVWDMRNRVCIHKFIDEGCIQGMSLAVSPNSQYLATGSDAGVVNVYETSGLLSSQSPKPIKNFLNLTTSASGLKFNCTSEILAFASCLKTNALKLAHFPSMRVFPNFPSLDINFLKPISWDISPGSAYMAIGNNAGEAHLYRLQHYSNY